MKISVEEAQDILDKLVERAEEGEDIVLTLDGGPVVRIVAISKPESETVTL